jgi:hypothetical protein
VRARRGREEQHAESCVRAHHRPGKREAKQAARRPRVTRDGHEATKQPCKGPAGFPYWEKQ